MTNLEIGAIIVSFFLAMLIELGLESTKNKIWKRLTVGIIGAIIGGILVLVFEIPHRFEKFDETMNKVDESIKETNVLYSVKSEIYKIENQRVKKYFEKWHNQLNDKLKKITEEKTLHIEKNEVNNAWTYIMDNSKNGDIIRATNIVSYYDWGEFDTSNGESIQKKAINKGVKIIRIYFSDENIKFHPQYTDTLYQRDLKNNIEAYKISYSIPQTQRYDKYYDILKSYDIVLLNDELLLITFTDGKKHQIKYSYLTYNKKYIDAATEYFNKLLSETNGTN